VRVRISRSRAVALRERARGFLDEIREEFGEACMEAYREYSQEFYEGGGFSIGECLWFIRRRVAAKSTAGN
jgi:hypothetical protein